MDLSSPFASAANATISTDKKIKCSFANCIGYPCKPTLKCIVCCADVHTAYVGIIVQRQEGAPWNIFCSPQYIRYFNDENIDNETIRQEWEALLEKTKLDWNQGLKVSVRIQGQGYCDLSKDAIICKIFEKKYVDQTISSATP
jgi:hypothetical protein